MPARLRIILWVLLFSGCLALCAQTAVPVSASADNEKAVQDSLLRQFNLEEVVVSARRKDEPVIPVQKLEGARLEGL
ncbi:MAG: hypothetical protein IJV55_05930, partial [Paludibacteraceae bacterium]|nr:hypothetical protein [Paludibacteraceae bacterium]